MNFPACDAICRILNPLDWSYEKNKLFVQACKEMAEFHAENSPDVRFLYQKYDFRPDELQSVDDLGKIPFINVHAMKYFLLTSLPEDLATLKLTSSGTRGQKTQIWFDKASLDRVQSMLDVLWEQEGLVSDDITNYANFIYDPEDAKDLGIAFSVKNEQRFTRVGKSFFTVRRDTSGNWFFDKRKTIEMLLSFAAEGRPVRILGIPSFIFELIEELQKRGPILLPPRSYLLTGGGWKAAEDKKVSRQQFRSLIEKYLGIPDENMRDGYGMAEHSAPYIECRLHKFHVPVYNRILVRDPVTTEVLPDGKPGLMEFITAYNAMMPNLALLSTDLGFVDPDPCNCGWKSPTFTLIGRGGIAKHKGCAITASEIVRRG